MPRTITSTSFKTRSNAVVLWTEATGERTTDDRLKDFFKNGAS